jgi:hypothetical protein
MLRRPPSLKGATHKACKVVTGVVEGLKASVLRSSRSLVRRVTRRRSTCAAAAAAKVVESGAAAVEVEADVCPAGEEVIVELLLLR